MHRLFVAALYDIHSNLPALEAVMEEVRRAGVARIVIGGDVVPGPMPRETLAFLQDLGSSVQFIQGNGDREVLAEMRGIETGAVPEPYRDAMRWVARELKAEYETVLASWPPTLRMDIPGAGRVLFCHATPRNDTEIFTRLTPDEVLQPIFEHLDIDLVVCGHTHMPFDRMVGRVRVVNAGSVGMPFNGPGADWLLFGHGVELRHTAYDLHGAARRIRGMTYPRADEFAERHVLNPPPEVETLESFRRVELK
jgi:predicted phosphodiesterase